MGNSGEAKLWGAAFQTLRREHGFEACAVEGTFPPEARGTLYRNGPGVFERHGRPYDHWFDGDGVVTALRIGEASVEGAVRVVETRGRARERDAGRVLFGGYNTRFARPFREMITGDTKNPANTGMLAFGKRTFALCEGGLPYELDAADLTTVGEVDWSGSIPRTFNPHPHRVPARKTTYSIGVRRGRQSFLDVFAIADGSETVRRLVSLTVPGLWMAHDFAVTERHLVVAVPPMRLRMLPVLLGRSGFVDALAWRAQDPTRLLVIPLDEPENPIEVEIASCFLEHYANAWEKDGELVLECVSYADIATMDRFVKALGRGIEDGNFGSTFVRFVIDLSKKRAKREELLRDPHELPQVALTRVGTKTRYTYLVGYSPAHADGRGLWDSVLKIDGNAGVVARFTPGEGQYPGEAIFAPRAGATDEDDGFLLVHVFDAKKGASREVVLDARRPGDGPIASATLPATVPVRLHGAFVGAA